MDSRPAEESGFVGVEKKGVGRTDANAVAVLARLFGLEFGAVAEDVRGGVFDGLHRQDLGGVGLAAFVEVSEVEFDADIRRVDIPDLDEGLDRRRGTHFQRSGGRGGLQGDPEIRPGFLNFGFPVGEFTALLEVVGAEDLAAFGHR